MYALCVVEDHTRLAYVALHAANCVTQCRSRCAAQLGSMGLTRYVNPANISVAQRLSIVQVVLSALCTSLFAREEARMRSIAPRKLVSTKNLAIAVVSSAAATAAAGAAAPPAMANFCRSTTLYGTGTAGPWTCLYNGFATVRKVSGFLVYPSSIGVCAGLTNNAFAKVHHITSGSVRGYRCGTGVVQCAGGGGLSCTGHYGDPFVHNPNGTAAGIYSGYWN